MTQWSDNFYIWPEYEFNFYDINGDEIFPCHSYNGVRLTVYNLKSGQKIHYKGQLVFVQLNDPTSSNKSNQTP